MNYRIDLHPFALAEIEDSFEWYEQCSTGLGNKFLGALQEKFDIISVSPKLYAKKKNNYRQVILDGFPFTIIYEVIEKQETVFVSHVSHTKRDPKQKFRK